MSEEFEQHDSHNAGMGYSTKSKAREEMEGVNQAESKKTTKLQDMQAQMRSPYNSLNEGKSFIMREIHQMNEDLKYIGFECFRYLGECCENHLQELCQM